MPSRCIGNPNGSNARIGLVIAWEVCQVKSKHILKGNRRLNLKTVQEAHVRTCCRTSESSGCVRLVFGNPSGSNARMGLVITWEGKQRLNLKRIQEAHVRMCCHTSESDGCVRVVLTIRVGLMLEWDLRSYERCVKSCLNTL
ncbi:uncharacterized protein G2W53_045013 [Senna tora]|uniref:Uncharacterized protein n=1 Tax=Senna tora TaxID=362788 RepID=A0A834SCF9_9FABA|nr:uncharacterized protein G2W53_045013 [Senna tora]